MWQKLKTFITVAEQAGFSKAAKKLGLSKTTVTRYIQELESEYQAKLFTRTTRHLHLTEQGEIFYHYALELLQLHDEAHNKIKHEENSVQGHIKIGLPFSILQCFAQKKLARLIRDYPDLSIEIVQGNHIADLLSSQFDLSIHCGPLPDVNFYYEKIANWQKILCASPKYLKKYGAPKKIDDLKKHRCLDHSDNHTHSWQLIVGEKLKNIPINPKLSVNSATILKDLAIQDLGIVYLPSFTVNDAISEKKLKPILKSAWPESLEIHALYPTRKRSNKKMMVVVEALKELLNN